MTGTLRLQIGSRGEPPLVLEYDLLVEEIKGGLSLFDRETGDRAQLWDLELQNVADAGKGATPLTALMLSHLLDEKFGLVN